MYKVRLKETKDKLETFVDFDEIVTFNERFVNFKCGKTLECCKEWHEQLSQFSIRYMRVCSPCEEMEV